MVLSLPTKRSMPVRRLGGVNGDDELEDSDDGADASSDPSSDISSLYQVIYTFTKPGTDSTGNAHSHQILYCRDENVFHTVALPLSNAT